jgi:hypothetical protein
MSDSAIEPDWEKFRVDTTFDPFGVQQQKLFMFMHEFIDWRAEAKKKPKPQSRKSKKKESGHELRRT